MILEMAAGLSGGVLKQGSDPAVLLVGEWHRRGKTQDLTLPSPIYQAVHIPSVEANGTFPLVAFDARVQPERLRHQPSVPL